MARSLGNRAVGATIDFKFNTHDAEGAPITLAGTPAVSVYKDNGTTESTAGVTLTVDQDGRTGMHHVRIVTTDAFYEAGSYQAVITTGTVDGISVVGVIVAHFTLGLIQAADVQQWLGVTPDELETAEDVAAAVLDADNDAHDTAGSIGANIATAASASGLDAAGVRAAIGMASANLDAQLSEKPNSTQVQAAAAAALTAYDPPTTAEMNARTRPSAEYATAANLATVDTVVDGIKAKTDAIQVVEGGSVKAHIAGIEGVGPIGAGGEGGQGVGGV